MAMHTPGPWKISHDSAGNHTVSHTSGGSMSIVADLKLWALCEEHGSIAANARLIAAAPELLESCEYIASIAPDCGRTAEGDGEELLTITITARGLAELRAAIRKARPMNGGG